MLNEKNNFAGLLLLDKPYGLTSHSAVQQVKKILKLVGKVGHTGSLDPLATGMLPVCIGEATKFTKFLLNQAKKYVVTLQFGIKTDTGDLAGKIIAIDPKNHALKFNPQDLEKALASMLGESWQVPPNFSAIKVNGTRAYKLARSINKENSANEQQPLELALAPRKITIYSIKLLAVGCSQQQLTLEIACSKGTYIRTLVEDLATKLDRLATVASLRRIAVGKFDLHTYKIFTLAALRQAAENLANPLAKILLPITACVAELTAINLKVEELGKLSQGKIIKIPVPNKIYAAGTLVQLINLNNQQFAGVGEIYQDDQIKAHRLLTNSYKLC